MRRLWYKGGDISGSIMDNTNRGCCNSNIVIPFCESSSNNKCCTISYCVIYYKRLVGREGVYCGYIVDTLVLDGSIYHHSHLEEDHLLFFCC